MQIRSWALFVAAIRAFSGSTPATPDSNMSRLGDEPNFSEFVGGPSGFAAVTGRR